MDAPEQSDIMKIFGLRPDSEVMRSGKVPIVGDMAYRTDNFVSDSDCAGPAGRQMFASDDHHLMGRPMSALMCDQVNARDGGQIARPKFLFRSTGFHKQPQFSHCERRKPGTSASQSGIERNGSSNILRVPDGKTR